LLEIAKNGMKVNAKQCNTENAIFLCKMLFSSKNQPFIAKFLMFSMIHPG
jgi:hypothetical protein